MLNLVKVLFEAIFRPSLGFEFGPLETKDKTARRPRLTSVFPVTSLIETK